MSLDSTMNFEITGPGGSSGAPEKPMDSVAREVFPKPSPSDSPGVNRSSPKLSKPESKDKISSVFYDDIQGDPGTLESTMNSVLEISFGK